MNKTIVFSRFSEMCKIIHKRYPQYNPVMIIGETPSKDRQDAVKKFNKDLSCKLLVMSSAGAYGLNLQAANIIIHFDQEWSLAKMEQRTGRAHRIGQKKNVMVYNLLAKGTTDMYVRRVLHSKAELSERMLGNITFGDLREMLTYND